MVHKQTRLVEVTHPTHYCFVEESLSWENNIIGVIYMMWIIWSINKWIMTCESRRLKAEQMFHKNKISLGEETESKFTFVTGFPSWMVRDNLCLLEWDCRDHFCSGPFIRKFQRSFLNNYSFFKQGNTMRKKKWVPKDFISKCKAAKHLLWIKIYGLQIDFTGLHTNHWPLDLVQKVMTDPVALFMLTVSGSR